MLKSNILFDLDGTVTDPKEGITKSVQYSLRSFGINAEKLADLVRFIGPPLKDSYKKYYGFTDDEADRAIAMYREYFSDKGIFENALYEGMPELLEKQKIAGKCLIMATSKPAVYAERILVHYGIRQYFDFVSGSELDGSRSRKCEVIQFALDNMNITDLPATIMIGDREHDIIGARETGIDSIGVLYGYGDLRELTKAGATFFAESVDALLKLLAPF